MPPENFHKQIVTFAAACVLFVGSLSYVVTIAFKSGEALSLDQDISEVEDYVDSLE